MKIFFLGILDEFINSSFFELQRTKWLQMNISLQKLFSKALPVCKSPQDNIQSTIGLMT